MPVETFEFSRVLVVTSYVFATDPTEVGSTATRHEVACTILLDRSFALGTRGQ